MSSFAGAHRCPAQGGAARIPRSGRLGGVVARLIDRFNEMVREDGPGAPVGRLIGLRPTSIETGKATFELEAGPQHANPMGTLHGGIICGVADSAMGPACASTLDARGRDWSKRLAEAGYAGLTGPKEYGGAGRPWRYQALYLEELARAEAPQHLGVIGLGMAGPTIIAHGRPDQKARYLAKILSAEEIWCQGFSEPGSGSDLASVRTRVELVGDRFVVNGQKVWSSYAHIADRCILLGRSTTASEKHEGLTYLIVDMKSPGVEVRPLRQITGEAEFNEIFL